MREHCERGYQMLRKIPYLREAAEIVYSHQEHFNGSGYPRGLRGDEIPLGARIFAVADALDAITSDRPYRSATSFATARKEIRKNMGTQFDPQVVDVFLQMPDRVWEDLRAEIQGEAQKFNPFSLGAVKHLLPRKDARAANEWHPKDHAGDQEIRRTGCRRVEGGGCEAAGLARGTRRADPHLQLSELRGRAGVCAVAGRGGGAETAPSGPGHPLQQGEGRAGDARCRRHYGKGHRAWPRRLTAWRLR